jgi:hypothetical protein
MFEKAKLQVLMNANSLHDIINTIDDSFPRGDTSCKAQLAKSKQFWKDDHLWHISLNSEVSSGVHSSSENDKLKN